MQHKKLFLLHLLIIFISLTSGAQDVVATFDYTKMRDYPWGVPDGVSLSMEDMCLNASGSGWWQFQVAEAEMESYSTYTITMCLKGSKEGDSSVVVGNWGKDGWFGVDKRLEFGEKWGINSVSFTTQTAFSTMNINLQPGAYDGILQIAWVVISKGVVNPESTPPIPGYNVFVGKDFDFEGLIFSVVDDKKLTCITKSGTSIKSGNSFSGNLVIPETVSDGVFDFKVVEIGDFGFYGCDEVTSVTLPSSIVSIGTSAFENCEGITTITLYEELKEIKINAFKGCPRITSLIGKGNIQDRNDIVSMLANPNLLVYVDSPELAPSDLTCNVVAINSTSGIGECERLILEPGYPFSPAISFNSKFSSMTKEFTQTTPIDGCAGWETIVLPFDATSVSVDDARGELTPFAMLDDISKQYPYWLYEADKNGEWKESFGIQAGIPYLISMPNNEAYSAPYRINGSVIFSNPSTVTITPQTTVPHAVTWSSGREFRSLWLPLSEAEENYAMGLNVNMDDLLDDTGNILAAGSAFHINVKPLPLEAYVTKIGNRKAMSLRNEQSHILLTQEDDDLTVAIGGNEIEIVSATNRRIDILTVDGVSIRSLYLIAGEKKKVEGLTKGIYIVCGKKIVIR